MTAPATMAAVTGASADWRTLNLAPGGRSLIEASAGTGKTWTIAVLYLRLLLERELSPRQIVVTTFTEAAAQELRERLRGKLEWALLQTDATAPEDDHSLDATWLHARWTERPEQRSRDLARLRLALAELDIAPVSTLHGLCRRVLADHPFACGVAFVPGDMVAGETLLAEVTEDLWRRLQQGDGSDELAALQRTVLPGLSLRELNAGLALCLKPGVAVAAASSVRIEEVLPTAWAERLRQLVAREGVFYQSSVLRRAWKELAQCIDGQAALPGQKTIDVLHGADELKGILKGAMDDGEVIAAASFSTQVAGALEALREQALRDFWSRASAFVGHEMQARLQLRRQMTFDALLGTVAGALEREAAAGAARPLADALFAAWPVALVDEFQDTDGQQYGILDAIYRDDSGGKRGRLVMIGDPKQAIYRFRGGDIHAYRRAADQVDADGRLTLGINYRSSVALVEACNQFYEHGGMVLGADEDAVGAIRYRRVLASDRRADQPYTVAGQVCAQPLQIHYWADAPVAAAERCDLALRVCANQIAELLQSGAHRIGDRPVAPSDIAVLLPTGRNIGDLRDLLAARGVPCASSSRSSVFQTDLARELQVVLYAVAHDDDLPALRAAAATRLWGDRYSQLRQRADDVASWQPVAHMFRQWHGLWRERGVQAVVDGLMAHMAPRYLQTLGGERALTDLRHLGELLQAQGEETAGTEELLAWFTSCRGDAAAAGDDAAEAAQLRIESDHARVQLMTLHASKGLEFPIVFLPLMWAHGERLGAGMHVVSDADGHRRVGFSAAARDSEARDLQDERFRVLYVALTRAIHACHVFALPPGRPANGRSDKPAAGTARSALDVMLARAQPPLPGDGEWPGELAAATPGLRWVEGWQPTAWRDFRAADSDDETRMARALPPPRSGPLEARHSFTTLIQGEAHEALDPGASAGDESDLEMSASAGDATVEPDGMTDGVTMPSPAETGAIAPHPELLPLAAVRGTDIGNAIHAVFEHRSIGVPLGAQRALIERCLEDAGVRRQGIAMPALVAALARRLQSALEAPLGLRDEPALRLTDLPEVDLCAEMEFTFVLDAVAMAALQRACARHGEGDLVPHGTRVLSGLMNGKIDLLFQHGGRFHVLDYKGNYLGETLADYQGEALRASMDQHRYRFQALIYTVAVDRYLRQRLGSAYRRGQHLGECIYLFVRAAGLAPDAGIWRHRFPDALLTAVGEVLDTHGHAGEAA
ncbi:MAG TPA: UvrD-helicase domain-containing protein [Rhodanobacter sp.]|nr:UvrD-helicase domain-containing protein [Rhodanobacter sp.]